MMPSSSCKVMCVCAYKKVNIICHGRVTQNVVDTFVLRRQFKNDIHPVPHTGYSFTFGICACALCLGCVLYVYMHIHILVVTTLYAQCTSVRVCVCGCSGAVFIIWCLFYSNIIQTRLHALGIEKSLWKRQHSIQQTHYAIALSYTHISGTGERKRRREIGYVYVTVTVAFAIAIGIGIPFRLGFPVSLSHSRSTLAAPSLSFTPLCTRYTAVMLPFVLILYSTKSRVVGWN